ncbi:MAG: L,D-transpeptidase [Hyphomicrobiales bacterium]
MILSRRKLLLTGCAVLMPTLPSFAQEEPLAEPELTIPEPETVSPGEDITKQQPETGEAQDGGYDADKLPPEESEEDFVIEAVNPEIIPEEFRRQDVPFDEPVEPGTIIVDPANRFLYHVIEPGRATRYGVGVGKQGFEWSGSASIGMKRRWPRWVPPHDMVSRNKLAKKWANGMPGGPGNPLGARAMYLFSNNADTLYRIHGTIEPESIGKAASSGCIRMLNEDIVLLYDKVEVGTPVIVRPAG